MCTGLTACSFLKGGKLFTGLHALSMPATREFAAAESEAWDTNCGAAPVAGMPSPLSNLRCLPNSCASCAAGGGQPPSCSSWSCSRLCCLPLDSEGKRSSSALRARGVRPSASPSGTGCGRPLAWSCPRFVLSDASWPSVRGKLGESSPGEAVPAIEVSSGGGASPCSSEQSLGCCAPSSLSCELPPVSSEGPAWFSLTARDASSPGFERATSPQDVPGKG